MIAAWGNKEFFVSPENLKSFKDLSESIKANVSTEENESGKDTTVLKGMGLNELSLQIKTHVNYGNRPANERLSWEKAVATSHLFMIGSQLLSNNPYMLQSADFSNYELGPNGEILGVEISLKFQETEEIISKQESEARAKAKQAKEEAKNKTKK